MRCVVLADVGNRHRILSADPFHGSPTELLQSGGRSLSACCALDGACGSWTSGRILAASHPQEGTQRAKWPTRATPHEFTILSASSDGPGLHGCITSTSQPVAPPNHVAATMIAELGGRECEEWLGIFGLCGIKVVNLTGEIELCGLTVAQRRLIQAVHSAACARYAGIEP